MYGLRMVASVESQVAAIAVLAVFLGLASRAYLVGYERRHGPHPFYIVADLITLVGGLMLLGGLGRAFGCQ